MKIRKILKEGTLPMQPKDGIIDWSSFFLLLSFRTLNQIIATWHIIVHRWRLVIMSSRFLFHYIRFASLLFSSLLGWTCSVCWIVSINSIIFDGLNWFRLEVCFIGTHVYAFLHSMRQQNLSWALMDLVCHHREPEQPFMSRHWSRW